LRATMVYADVEKEPLKRLACFAVHGLSQPRLLKRIFYLSVYSWLLRRCPGMLECVLIAIVFLIWLSWDAHKLSEIQHATTKMDLAPALKVAEFAQGSMVARLGDRVTGLDGGLPSGGYTGSEASRRFSELRRKTHCLFAAKAVVWGNDWVEVPTSAGNPLAYNIVRCLPRFYRFCLESRAGRDVDGFVFEARGKQYGETLEAFAWTVRQVLDGLSAADPAGVQCMRSKSIARRGWYFEFARESFFVTTFAPCYSETNPRYQFGFHPESCFVLLQPEESFLRHDLPHDRPRSATNWECPVDIRDRIRVNFQRHGREYRIPETVSYPPAEFVVAPLDPLVDSSVEFWRAEPPPDKEKTVDRTS